MLRQPENNSVLANHLLFIWASTIAAGVIIVVWQNGKYFNLTFHDYTGWFLLTSFSLIDLIASGFVYIRAKENRLIQTISTLLLTPVFIIVFTLLTAFMSEMFYGGSGYHGEYMFPFLRRTQY